jgi:hypothetical protein
MSAATGFSQYRAGELAVDRFIHMTGILAGVVGSAVLVGIAASVGAGLVRLGVPASAADLRARTGAPEEQSRREFASGGAATRAQDAAVQIGAIRPTFPQHACRRPQQLQPSTPSRFAIDVADLPSRGGERMAQCRRGRVITRSGSDSFCSPRVNLTMPRDVVPERVLAVYRLRLSHARASLGAEANNALLSSGADPCAYPTASRTQCAFNGSLVAPAGSVRSECPTPARFACSKQRPRTRAEGTLRGAFRATVFLGPVRPE